MRRRHASGVESGFALLIVLWTLIPIALLFAMLAAAARSDAQLTANLRSGAELEAAADGAIYSALFDLLQRGVASRNGPPLAMQLAGADVLVGVGNESGLVNPNTASPRVLGALLVRLGADPAQASSVASAVADWRTPGRRSAQGRARAARYQAAGLDYAPPGAPFESLSELGEVLGMTPALLQALAPHLTLYSDGDPDPASADPIVRAALRDLGAIAVASETESRVVRITAIARRLNGARATRRAIIQVGPSPNRRGWRVLVWDTPHDA